jgi:cyanophycinase
VTVVDPSEVNFSSIASADEGQPVCMLGLRLHVLVAGATYDLNTASASATALIQSKE